MSGTRAADNDALFAWMDAFRTLAAVVVVASHARDLVMRDYSGPPVYAPFYAATGLGHSGVILFFVLSGFWISRAVQARLDEPRFWTGYLIDRLSRLMIVLLPAVLLGGALDYLGAVQLGLPIYSGEAGPHSIREAVAPRLSPSVMLGNVAFLQTILVPTWGSNGPLWSLAFEFWYYVWFAALALLVARKQFSIALLGLVVGYANPQIAVGFASWMVGYALLRLLDRQLSLGRARHGIVLATVGIFTATLLASKFVTIGVMDFLLALSFGVLLLVLHAGRIGFPAILEPVARFGRNASYSLYAIHFPILALCAGLLTDSRRMEPGLPGIVTVLLLSLGCLGAGWSFSRLTERHTACVRRYFRRLFRLSGSTP
jgi:peptidoglycan/LPS O-acetylase OafA/YrhL